MSAPRRYPCGDACDGCQDDPSGASCDHLRGQRVEPPAREDRVQTHDRGSTGGVPWDDLPAVKSALGDRGDE